MILKAIIEDQEYTLNVPEAILAQGEAFFAQLDRDMDGGWQMSRDWVESPDRLQRCQIVADKLLTALEKEHEKLGMLMAGYILSRAPDVEAVDIDIHGEIQNTSFTFREGQEASQAQPQPQPVARGVPGGMSKLAAMEQAGNDVTKVFRVGKGWRFSVYDHRSGQWQDSPLIASQDEAERLRQEAFKTRFEALQHGRN